MSNAALLSYNETSTTTVCPTLIDRQAEQERLQIHIGKDNLKKATIKAENRAYASSTIYGVTSIQELIPHVEAAITNIKTRIHKGKNGAAFREIKEYLDDIEPLVAAGIACKIVFDKVFSFKDEDDSLLVNVADSVGTALMQECQMRYYERKAPGLLKVLKDNYWHSACGTQQKLTDVQLMMKRADITWKSWPRQVRVKLGNVLIDTVVTTSGWFTDHVARVGRTTRTYLVPTPAFMDIKDKILAQAELFSAEHWPMLIPPRPWSDNGTGGYLLDEVMRGHDMVRRGNPGRIQGEHPIEFLNRIQSVAYQLNPFMVHVAETLYAKGWVVGIKDPKFIPHTASEPLPPKPADIDTNEVARKRYCREAAEVYNRNHALVRKSCRTRMTMNAIDRFKDVDRFYLPWSFDYRGRAYPIPAFLTPQDTDFGKSLLRFADGSFVTPEAEDWLAFQVATTFGLDKAPMTERLAWTKDNHELITLVAEDPIDNLHLWENVSEPFQFLAACEEYNACVIHGIRQFTSLMVATDATCSGLQILAGLARDRSTAQLVNVLPGDRPQDAYKAVAELAKPNCPEQWREHIDRGVAKRLVISKPLPLSLSVRAMWT